MRLKVFACLLLFTSIAQAQTVQNPSFESPVTFTTTNANGSYEIRTVPGWTGTWGVWKPNATEYATLPDGTQVLFSASGPETQDLGPQQAGTYKLTIQQGNRGDGAGNAASCTVQLDTTSITTANADIPVGTWQAVTLSYTPASPSGDLILSLSASGGQCNFDNVSLAFTPAVLPNIVTIQFPVQLTTCTKCDGTDDQGASALGLLAGSTIALTSDTSSLCKGTLNANAQMVCSSGIDISPALVPLTLTVTSPDGSIGYTDSQQILGLLFTGRGIINIIGLFDSANLQPRGMRVFTQ